MNLHCPDCHTELKRRPSFKQDGRCRGCQSGLQTRDQRRKAKAKARREEADAQLADAYV